MSEETPLEDLDVSPRTAAFLAKLGVETVEELVKLPEIRAPRAVAAEIEALFSELDIDYAGELVVEAAPPSVRAGGDVLARWKQITAWLEENQPETLATFREPAAGPDIALAEKAIGRELPVDYKRFLAKHDGQEPGGPMVGTCTLFPIEDVPAEHAALVKLFEGASEIDEESNAPGVRPVEYSPGWVPIGRSARGRDFMCIDLDPAEGGVSGQIIMIAVDDDAQELIAKSFADMLSVFFEKLQAGEIEPGDEDVAPSSAFDADEDDDASDDYDNDYDDAGDDEP